MLPIIEEITMSKKQNTRTNRKRKSTNRYFMTRMNGNYPVNTKFFDLDTDNALESYIEQAKHDLLTNKQFSEEDVERMLNNADITIRYTENGKLLTEAGFNQYVQNASEEKKDYITLDWTEYNKLSENKLENHEETVLTMTHRTIRLPKDSNYHEVEKVILDFAAKTLGSKKAAKQYLHSQHLILHIRNGNKHYVCPGFTRDIVRIVGKIGEYIDTGIL